MHFLMSHKESKEIREFYGWLHIAGGNACVETTDMEVPEGFQVVLEDVVNPWGNHLTVLLPVDWEVIRFYVRHKVPSGHYECTTLVVYPEVPEDSGWHPLSDYECQAGYAVYGHPDHDPIVVRMAE